MALPIGYFMADQIAILGLRDDIMVREESCMDISVPL